MNTEANTTSEDPEKVESPKTVGSEDLMPMPSAFDDPRLMARILDMIPNPVYYKDRHGVYQGCNTAMEAIFSLPKNQIVGHSVKNFLHLFSDEQLAIFQETDAEVFSTGTTQTFKTSLKFADQQEREVILYKIPYYNSSGTLVGLVGVVHDVTKQSQAESELQQAKRLASIGQLAAGIAHEINTPTQYISDNVQFLRQAFSSFDNLLEAYEELVATITATDGYPQTLSEIKSQMDYSFLKTEVFKAIEESLQGLERVTAIVRALKEFSHPGGNKKQLISINKLLDTTIVVSTNEWKYVATIEKEFDFTLPSVPCYPGELNQVWLNLIVNAAQAIEERFGKSAVKQGVIRISTRNTGNFAEVRIEDNGIGIPEANKDKIFDLFFTTKTVGKGTGQGMSVVYSVIVEKHGGTISFDSVVNEGTKFVIKLPME